MTWLNSKKEKVKKLPAIPPNDYTGTIADWQVALMERGYMRPDGTPFYGDIDLSIKEYEEILEECEK
jgi:hypothetical protein